ncbi:MAG TPA: SDR family NAD(P)-dependent oxidoreductase [Pirellulales bacterium]|jgi:NAD(P)-dependent dehydrogenase (short-subunit alcohol dehydrogenase family)
MPPSSRNAIITGSASGLGRALALRLARDGWQMALVDVNEAGNEDTLKLARAAGGDGFTYRMDVAQPEEWQKFHDLLRGKWQALDLLVNNAGVAGSGEVGKYTLDDWHWILGINLNAGIYGCHFFIPWLKESARGANIINTASLAAIAAKPGMAGYNVAKAGMLSLSETLYGELKPHKIGVTVICPAFFQTNLLNEGRLHEIDRAFAAKMMKTASFTAEDVAEEAIRVMQSGKLYVVMPRQGRTFWRLKRWFPSYILNMLAKDWVKQLAYEAKRAKPAAAEASSPERQKV